MNSELLVDRVIPLEYHLSQNYPNPFRRKTCVKYCLASKTWVRLVVLNPGGEVIDLLVDEVKHAGTYEVQFDAAVSRIGRRRTLESGLYPYRLEAGDFTCEKSMIIQT